MRALCSRRPDDGSSSLEGLLSPRSHSSLRCGSITQPNGCVERLSNVIIQEVGQSPIADCGEVRERQEFKTERMSEEAGRCGSGSTRSRTDPSRVFDPVPGSTV